MDIIERKKALLEKPEHYDGYSVTLKVKDIKTVEEDSKEIHIFDDGKKIFVVDITVSINGEQFFFNDYYINIDDNVEDINNVIAKIIVKRINTITFDNAKFIGAITNSPSGIVISNDSVIVNALKREQYSEANDRLCYIYLKYQEYKEKNKKDLLMKYAAFLDYKFSNMDPVPLPDVIKGIYFKRQNIEDSIYNHNLLEQMIKDELKGKASDYSGRMNEIEEVYNRLYSENAYMESRGPFITVFQQISEKINKFLEEKVSKEVKSDQPTKKSILNVFGKKKQESVDVSDDKSDEYKLKTSISHLLETYGLDDETIARLKRLPIAKLKEVVESNIERWNDSCNSAHKNYESLLSNEKEKNPAADLYTLKAYKENLSFGNLYEYVDGITTDLYEYLDDAAETKDNKKKD